MDIRFYGTPWLENNMTFPTDAKLTKKIIDLCNEIAKQENIINTKVMFVTSKE